MEYWIWLQSALGAAAKTNEMLSFFGSPREIYKAGRREWLLSGLISSEAAEKLSKKNPSQAGEVIEKCTKNGWHIITPDSPRYPLGLREISSSPAVLYVWGDPDVLCSKIMISFVGTRHASRYGLDVSRQLAYGVARAGVTLVSGGALGIDSSSHMGALDAGGKTIAFLGCGLGHGYLRENEVLRREIAANGAVVSEFQPFTPPTRQSFPIRNRLISGISLGTVVIEAGIKSGSLITAKYASQQGRDVFAVPGDIISSNYTGANMLIKDGAKAVFSADDILDEYSYVYPGLIKKASENKKDAVTCPRENFLAADAQNNHKTAKPANICSKRQRVKPFKKKELSQSFGKTAAAVHGCLDDCPKLADTIAEECDTVITEVLCALTELELYGYAVRCEGNMFTAQTV